MKFILFLLFVTFPLAAFSQNVLDHPRVMELEDKMVKEGSSYFARRYPGDPFFIKVNIRPLRRVVEKNNGEENLPYHDSDSEEMVDEWDDPTTSLSSLRNRLEKVSVEVSVPMNFDDQRLSDIKQELSVYLRLLPYRDEVKVEKKLKVIDQVTPNYIYYIIGGFVGGAFLLGIMLRWSLGTIKTQNVNTGVTPPDGFMATLAPAPTANMTSNSSFKTDVQGDVNFHDPIKILEIVHKKLNQIEQSKTFPTLKDVIELDSLCQINPTQLGALVFELSQESHRSLFKMGRETNWLQAFSAPGTINQNCLKALEKMTHERQLSSGDRDLEDLLIQIWRIKDKAATFFKMIDSEHAFILLNLMPKSISLHLAKKAFPGSWGKLLENRSTNVVIEPKITKEYLRKALELTPWFQPKILENFKKDKEILSYLDKVNVNDEKDLYETLPEDSFILKVRPAFYKVFELESENLTSLVALFPVEKWALVLINSSRTYLRIISDKLDDKKKMVLSTHFKRFDQQGVNVEEQNIWKNLMAKEAQKFLNLEPTNTSLTLVEGAESDSQKHSA